MKLKMKHLNIAALSSTLFFASCSEKEKAEVSQPQNKDAFGEIVLSNAPEKALDIAALRTTAKAGDEVTFAGSILGSDPVFVENRSVMIMGDPKKLTACSLRPGDECVTPWDVCCDDPDVIKSSIVTVQVVDENGQPLKQGLKGVGGMKELSQVIVTGEVAEGSTASNMLVNATGIFVQP